MTRPLISVCIPVYGTEPYLAQCLRSVIVQDFDSFEVIVVSDASTGKDEKKRSAKKLVKLAQKECRNFRKEKNLSPVKFTFIENRENRGILEVRRTLVNEACGSYVTMLDSDDVMEEGALSAIYQACGAGEDGAGGTYDIVQGTSTAGVFNSEGNFVPSKINFYSQIVNEEICGHEIFHKWLAEGKIPGVLWAKLIKRSLYLKAFESIPYTECNMGEDFLLFFFITLSAEKYIGIKNKVYLYRVTSGISSPRKIDTLKKWKLVCSAASVFTVVSTWIEEHKENSPLSEEEIKIIKNRTCHYLANNISQMNEKVVPELLPEAREMLCEYWGRSFVERIEKVISGNRQFLQK